MVTSDSCYSKAKAVVLLDTYVYVRSQHFPVFPLWRI